MGQTHDGVRTMICGMHHMPPPVARRILADAFAKRQPLCVFEISDNTSPKALWWLAVPVNVLVVLLMTPLVRPVSFRQLLLTYVIPLFPFVIAWDGAVSNAPTYTRADMGELLKGLEAKDYEWEIGTVKKAGMPGEMAYLLGLPKAAS